MAQPLVMIGASIFLLLGMLHGILTLIDLKRPKTFTPRDPELHRAMQQSSIALHPSTNLWKAWLGFNLSHSLGIILFAAAYLYIGIFQPTVFPHSVALQATAIIVSAIYLTLSLNFWFSIPAIGSFFALICLAGAAIFAHI